MLGKTIVLVPLPQLLKQTAKLRLALKPKTATPSEGGGGEVSGSERVAWYSPISTV